MSGPTGDDWWDNMDRLDKMVTFGMLVVVFLTAGLAAWLAKAGA